MKKLLLFCFQLGIAQLLFSQSDINSYTFDTVCYNQNVLLKTNRSASADWYNSSASNVLATGANCSVIAQSNNVYVAKFTDNDWAKIFANYTQTYAIKTNGTLWGWGTNGNGELGQNKISTTPYYRPVQIGKDSNWKSISVGSRYFLAIKKNGTLWACGYNYSGQLGDNTQTDRYTPVQIGTDSNWIMVSASYTASFGLKADGSIWSWGSNNYYQLGDSSLSINFNRTYPQQIGNAKDWRKIEAGYNHVIAIKNNGSLWAWGVNTYGAIGDSTTISKKLPTRVGNDSDWLDVNAAYYSNIALKSNHSLYTWGYNAFGEIGDSTFVNRLQPTRIGKFNNYWKSISASYQSFSAIDSNSNVWAWGRNNSGELGDSTQINRKFPVKINAIPTDASATVYSYYRTYYIDANKNIYTMGDNSICLGSDSISGAHIYPNVIKSYNAFKFIVQKFTPSTIANRPSQCLSNNQFLVSDNSTLNFGFYTREWETGIGPKTALPYVIISYPDAGFKFLKLKVTSALGCMDSSLRTLRVNEMPKAIFNVNKTKQCINGNQFMFTNASLSNSSIRSYWDFGNGDTSTMFSSVNVYNTGGNYTVRLIVSDTNNCYDTTKTDIYVSQIQTQSICKVGVDSMSRKNLIVWEPINKASQSYYSIYKETAFSGAYALLKNISANLPGIYLDSSSNPEVKSENYVIVSHDTCGDDSNKSGPHKTAHLMLSNGAANEVNLFWENYSGRDIKNIDIYRGATMNEMKLLTSVQNSIQTYTDYAAPQGPLFYIIAANLGQNCRPDNANEMISPYSLSNYVKRNLSGLTEMNMDDIEIYPNPTLGKFYLHARFDVKKENILLMDVNGKIIDLQSKINYESANRWRIENLNPGVYILNVNRGFNSIRKKIIVE